jgi:rhodanese-related sulfurtransferase
MKTITPTDPTALRQSGTACALLDVRTPAEHEKIHTPGVHLVPVDELDPEDLAKTNGFSKDETIYILCHPWARAKRAARKMEGKGFQDSIVVSGGKAAGRRRPCRPIKPSAVCSHLTIRCSSSPV